MKPRKTLNQQEYDWLMRIEANIDSAWNDLNDWEKIFMEGILENFKKYGMKTFFSKGQWNVLTRISEKII